MTTPTCAKVRDYLFAFLDNELEPGLSIKVQTHLEHCPACAREAEIERAIRRALDGALAHASPPEFHQDAILRSLDVAAPRGSRGFLRRPWFRTPAIAGAAALALTAALWSALAPRPGAAPGFVDLVAEESGEFLEHAGPVQLATSETPALTAWLRAQTALEVDFADPSPSGWRLIGARRCSLAGRPAAFALLERQGLTASLVAVNDDVPEATHNLKSTISGSEVHWVGRCRGRNIVASKRGGLVYYAVSDHPASELHDLVREPGR